MVEKEGLRRYRGSFTHRKGQVTLFVILAIIIVAVVVLVFVFRGGLRTNPVPDTLAPVYQYYQSCISDAMMRGVHILGHQSGYLEKPAFRPGSSYMPFSSELGFLGTGVPYWYSITGNGLVIDQQPRKVTMEEQLADFIADDLALCDFSSFSQQGYRVGLSENPSVYVSIEKEKVVASVEQDVSLGFGEVTWFMADHDVVVPSRLGHLYTVASTIYTHEKDTAFLEEYGVDILRLYAPVDGSMVQCSTAVWPLADIRSDLSEALAANVPATKVKGSYYTLRDESHQYFVTDVGTPVDVDVSFLYDSEWPLKVEAWPSEGNVLRADPVGLQEGLGLLGFCYVTYHFVYDFAYPVLIQLSSGSDLFQFPVVVYVAKNQPREGGDVSGTSSPVPALCQHPLTEVTVETFNSQLTPVAADIGFECFDTSCPIGTTQLSGNDASLTARFPQCVNGYITARAEGYAPARYLVSTMQKSSVNIVLDKEYPLALTVRQDGRDISGSAVVTFAREDGAVTVAYPEQRDVTLREGQYTISTYVYGDSSVSLPGTSKEECVTVPQGGVFGFLGATEEQCFDVSIPAQTIDTAIVGGGTQPYYLAESELQRSRQVVLDVPGFGTPRSAEDLQVNFNRIEVSDVGVFFS